jgi:hypothetical protein
MDNKQKIKVFKSSNKNIKQSKKLLNKNKIQAKFKNINKTQKNRISIKKNKPKKNIILHPSTTSVAIIPQSSLYPSSTSAAIIPQSSLHPSTSSAAIIPQSSLYPSAAIIPQSSLYPSAAIIPHSSLLHPSTSSAAIIPQSSLHPSISMINNPVMISIIIMGHGAIKNELPLEVFVKPNFVKRTNILGMRFSGINNIGDRLYEEEIDTFLSMNKNNLTDTLIRNLDITFLRYLQHPKNTSVKERIDIIKQRYDIKNNYFGIVENYSTRRAQKIYQGANDTEISGGYRHRELTKIGPLVKVYSIKINGIEVMQQGQYIIIRDNIVNGITLTQIINMVSQSFLNSHFVTPLQAQDIASKKNITVNVVDLTCNSTQGFPLIEFIGISKKK